MNNIKLDITKAACFLEAGAVKAFEVASALRDYTCVHRRDCSLRKGAARQL